MLRAGLLLRWHTNATQLGPKRKRFVCVAPDAGLFLIINSRDLWGASFKLLAANCSGGLDYDSFVELRAVVERDPAEVLRAMQNGRVDLLGQLDRWALRNLQQAVAGALTLTGEQTVAIEAAIAEALIDP